MENIKIEVEEYEVMKDKDEGLEKVITKIEIEDDLLGIQDEVMGDEDVEKEKLVSDDEKIEENIKKKSFNEMTAEERKEGQREKVISCSVPGCYSRFPRNSDEGYKFPHNHRDNSQRRNWLRAVGRKKGDGTPWHPHPYKRICRHHFFGNRAGDDRHQLNYIPIKFSVKRPFKDFQPNFKGNRGNLTKEEQNALEKKQFKAYTKLQNTPMYKKFRMSRCTRNGWTITNDQGGSYENMSKMLKSCWEQKFKDCKIVCRDGGFVQCHSAILSMASPVFKELLHLEEVKDEKVIMLPDFSMNAVQLFVSHCYCSEDYPEEDVSDSLVNETHNLLTFLKIKDNIVPRVSRTGPSKRSKRLVEGAMEGDTVEEFGKELSDRLEVILVAHLTSNNCCPTMCSDRPLFQNHQNMTKAIQLDWKGCVAYVADELVGHPDWLKEHSVKYGYVHQDGTVSLEKISSTITFQSPKEVVALRDPDDVNKLLVLEYGEDFKPATGFLLGENEETSESAKEEPENEKKVNGKKVVKEVIIKRPEPQKKPYTIKVKSSSTKPISFKCATCQMSIKTTINQHNNVVTQVNARLGGKQKQQVGIVYQCHKCLTDGIKPDKNVKREGWIYVSDFSEPPAQVVIGNNDDSLLCPECGKGFKSKNGLNWHLNEHRGMKLFKCGDCEESFCSPDEMKKHNKEVHNKKLPLKEKKCYRCAEVFKLEGMRITEVQELVEKHKKNHHSPELKYKCGECAFRADSEEVINDHRERCHGPKQIQCDKCPQMIANRYIKRHIQQCHNPDFPFECDQCQYRANSQYAINWHAGKYHTDPSLRQWECTLGCGKAFIKDFTMRYHVKKYCSLREKNDSEDDETG